MSEQGDPVGNPEPPRPEPRYDPGPDFKEKVKAAVVEVLDDLGIGKGAPEEPEPKAQKRKTLREEEFDMEGAVEKVLAKMAAKEPAKTPAPAAEPEAAPGPPPKKKRLQTAIWGE